MSISVGISTASLYPMLLEDSIDLLAKRDIKLIEIFVNTFSEIKPEFMSEISKRVRYNGQTVAAIHPFTSGFEPFMLFTSYPRRVDDSIELHKHYFSAMNQLNCKIFVFHGDRGASDLPSEEYYERFARLRDVGKTFGVTVAQENVERCKSTSLDFLSGMVDYLDGDVALVFDNKQATRSGISAEQFISTVGKNIVHCHMSDSDLESDCKAIGDGEVDFNGIRNLLETNGYSGVAMVELYLSTLENEEKVFESRNILKDFFE